MYISVSLTRVLWREWPHLIRGRDFVTLRNRSVPIRRSTYGFCQGDLGAIGRSRIPIVRTRFVKACP